MTASHCPPNACPIGIEQEIVRHDERIRALTERVKTTEGGIKEIRRRMDKWMTGVVTLLLGIIALLVKVMLK
jgi:hypothetical protein